MREGRRAQAGHERAAGSFLLAAATHEDVWRRRLVCSQHAARSPSPPPAALLGGCECRCSNTDASIIVADVAPAGDSFQAVCRRREAATGQAADKWRESGKTMLKLLGLSK